MGRIQHPNSSTSSSAMDISPRSSSWNSLCPSFLDSRKIHLQDESSGSVIGSPPPAGPSETLWNENHPMEVPNMKICDDGNNHPGEKIATETSELSLRVQGIRLQPPPQPMIICENVEDEKVDTSEMVSSDNVSLTVPPVDVENEKKRPPLSASF